MWGTIKVYPDPEVVVSLTLEVEPELAQRHPEVDPVGVLTRSQVQKQGHDVDLADSLLPAVFAMNKKSARDLRKLIALFLLLRYHCP